MTDDQDNSPLSSIAGIDPTRIDGISLRDLFAAVFMSASLVKTGYADPNESYEVADKMMEARKQ